MRTGRYKKNFLQPEQCADWAQGMRIFIDDLRAQALLLSEPEFVAKYFLFGFKLAKKILNESWKGARFHPDTWPQSWRQSCAPASALSEIAEYSLRGVPLSANRSLLAWNVGEYRLKLFFDVPSIAEVLLMQSQGIRCVTCLLDEHQLQAYVLGERDPLSFTLHDLIHADHFLAQAEQRQVQIGFSRWLWKIWQANEPQKIASLHKEFLIQFEYVSADMNSHGAHLAKYLKAILCQHQSQSVLPEWASLGGFESQFTQALLALNTPQEKPEHLACIQQQLFAYGRDQISS